jgi:hypothetical protein
VEWRKIPLYKIAVSAAMSGAVITLQEDFVETRVEYGS